MNYETIKIEELIGKGKNKILMSEVPLEKSAIYACEDADLTFQLTRILEQQLKDKSLHDFFKTIELPLIPVLMEMEYNGVFVDSEMLLSMSQEISKKLDIFQEKIFSVSGKEFNINSTQQLANILFDEMKLPQIKKRSTAEEVLKN